MNRTVHPERLAPVLLQSASTAGESRSKPSDAITDSIVCSSTYTFEDTQSIIDFIEESQPREEYGRYGNPNEKVVESKLAALDGGEEAIVVRERNGRDRWIADGKVERGR